MFKTKNQDKCKILLINETSREVQIVTGKALEGQITYKDRTWLVQTDPLFMKKESLYIVSDGHIPTFKLEYEKEEKDIDENNQISLKPESLSPTALKKAVTSSFFKALMAPVHWDRADWIKALMFGSMSYILLKSILIAVFERNVLP